MKIHELPEGVREWWNTLDNSRQREAMTCLRENLKPLTYKLRVKAKAEEVLRVLAFIQRHSERTTKPLVVSQVRREGGKVVFCFNDIESRNVALLGQMFETPEEEENEE
jgi:hypothetical protein